MNLAFKTLALRSLCECQIKAENTYGYSVAKQLRARLSELRALDDASTFPAGNPVLIPAQPCKLISLALSNGYRLIISQNHAKVPLLETGEIDWSQVTRLMILRIEK